MGRKKIIIDWEEVDECLEAGANGVQVAAILGIHFNTLASKCKTQKKSDFSDYLRQKREKGNSKLLKKQFNSAMDGDRGMLIWLGKQRLGQADKREVEQKTSIEAVKIEMKSNGIEPVTEEEFLDD